MKNSAPSRGSGLASCMAHAKRCGIYKQVDGGCRGRHGALQSGFPGSSGKVGHECLGSLGMAVPDLHPRRARRSGARRRPPARLLRRPARARSCPPGPRERAPAERSGTPRRRCCRPAPARPRKDSVLAAPTIRATSVGSSAASSARSLWGIVTFAPTNPCPGRDSSTLGEPRRLDVERLVAPVEAELAEGGVVHRRRAAVPDGVARAVQRAVMEYRVGFAHP